MSRLIPAALFLLWGALAQDTPPPADPAPQDLGKVTLTLDVGGHTHDIKKLAFTPDGKHLVTGSGDGSIRVWDVESGRTVRRIYPPERRANGLFALAPDGQRLAVVSGTTGGSVVYLMGLADGKIEQALGGHPGIVALAFSADGRRLASAGTDKIVRVWDLAVGKAVQEFTRPLVTTAVAFAPDGNRLALFDSDHQAVTYDLASGKARNLVRVGSTNWPSYDKVAWSRDGKTVAAASANGMRLFEPDGKQRHYLLGGQWCHSVALSGDSRRVVTVSLGKNGEWRAHVFDVRTGKQQAAYLLKYLFPWTAAFAPDGETVAVGTGGDNPGVHLWRVADGKFVKRLGAANWVRDDVKAGWSADGKAVVWRSVADPAKFRGPVGFNVATLELVPASAVRRPSGPVEQQGPLALRAAGDAVQVLKGGKLLTTLKLPPGVLKGPPRVMSLIGPDRAAFGAATYGYYLYELPSGKFIRRVNHPGWLLSMAPSPGGKLLASLSEDQTLRVFNAKSGAPLLTFYLARGDWIAWTPRGYYAATPGGERLMGFTVNNGPGKETAFYPADRFRKLLYRPDIVRRVLETGDVDAAVAAADAEAGTKTRDVPLAELLPPRATLTVADRSALPTMKVKARAEAAAKGQPVTALRLLLDGRPLPGGAGLAEFAGGKPTAEVEWTVTLPDGPHQLAVLARSPDASSVSPVVEVQGSAATKSAALHVLAVGVDQYQDPTLRLQFAAADAKSIAKALRDSAGGPYRAGAVRTLTDAEASKPAVLQALAQLRAQAQPNDLVIVFFAGHGVKDKAGFYLLTVEANTQALPKTTLSGGELRKTLGEFPCQVLLMLDACHSGGVAKSFRPVVDDLTRALTDDECGVAVLSAAMASEQAQEKDGHGLFTKAILEALGPAEGVPFNRHNRLLYVHHLHSYVFDEVAQASGERQHPFLSLPWVVEPFPIRQVKMK